MKEQFSARAIVRRMKATMYECTVRSTVTKREERGTP